MVEFLLFMSTNFDFLLGQLIACLHRYLHAQGVVTGAESLKYSD